MIAFHKIFVFHPIITRESSLGTKFLKPASSHALVKAHDFLGQYQMMEQRGVASAEEVKAENLADHLRIEITARGTACATPSCGRSSCCSTSHRLISPVGRTRDLPIALGVADGGIYASLALALMIAVTLAVLILVFLFFRYTPLGFGDAGGSGIRCPVHWSAFVSAGCQPSAGGWPLQLERWPE
jgi:hypothetical protein